VGLGFGFFVMSKNIVLSTGNIAIVDDCDYDELSKFRWTEHKSSAYKTSYATRSVKIDGKKKRIWMHRIINNTPDGFQTDHINHNGLDNRRSNLKTVTASQNCENRRIRSDSGTGIKNISKIIKRNKEYYVFRAIRNRVRLKSKYFNTIDDAIRHAQSI